MSRIFRNSKEFEKHYKQVEEDVKKEMIEKLKGKTPEEIEAIGKELLTIASELKENISKKYF